MVLVLFAWATKGILEKEDFLLTIAIGRAKSVVSYVMLVIKVSAISMMIRKFLKEPSSIYLEMCAYFITKKGLKGYLFLPVDIEQG